jgi:hypothetical protein
MVVISWRAYEENGYRGIGSVRMTSISTIVAQRVVLKLQILRAFSPFAKTLGASRLRSAYRADESSVGDALCNGRRELSSYHFLVLWRL